MRVENKKGILNKSIRVGGVRLKFRFFPIMLCTMLLVIFGIKGFAKERPASQDSGVTEGSQIAQEGSFVQGAGTSAINAANSAIKKIEESKKEKTAQTSKERAAALNASNKDSGKAEVKPNTKSDNAAEAASEKEESQSWEETEAAEETTNYETESDAEYKDSYDNGFEEATSDSGIYIAGDDDTLWDIAIKFGLDLDELISYNPDLDPDVIAGGYEIRVKPSEDASYDYDDGEDYSDSSSEDEDYEVQEDETVAIAATTDAATQTEEPVVEDISEEPTFVEEEDASQEIEERAVEETVEETAVEEPEEEYVEETTSEPSSLGQAIVDAALSQIGVTQTCTQLVSNSLAAAGINFGGSPYDYTSLGQWTDNPQPGDICIYEGHVAIYIGNGQAVHGGWMGFGHYNSTQIFSVYVSTNTFLGYIHIPG